MRTIVITGSASGMGAATKARLETAGDRVIGVDLRNADVVADLGTADGRKAAIDAVTTLSGGRIDGLVTWAGLPGLTDRPGSLLASVNYFGSVALLAGLRPLLAKGDRPSAVAISSNSTTCQPGVPMDVVALCLAGDEPGARAAAIAAKILAEEQSPITARTLCFEVKPEATKTAIAHWVRRNAPGPEWAGAGITLNAVAPGAVETPLLQASRNDPVIGEMVDAFPVPIGRKAEPDELAAFVQFLLGPDARFFCGSVVFVDGGTDAQFRADDFPRPM